MVRTGSHCRRTSLATRSATSGGRCCLSIRRLSSATLASADSAPRQAEALPKREFIAPKLVAAKKEGISSTVHYGVNSRSELMGRAAGPIFNFKGRGAKKAETSDGNILSQVATQIEEARKQVEGSSLDDKTKKDLSEKLQLVNDGIGN